MLKRKSVLAATLLLLGAGYAPQARADIISISAAGMIQQLPCAVSGCRAELNNGVMVATDIGRYFAAVDFPVNGNKICSLSII